MNFWLRNIIIGLILIAIAAALILNKDTLSVLDEEYAARANENTSEEVSADESSAPAKKPIKKKKSTNAAAEGLSRFYASLNSDIDEKGLKIKNNMIFLPEPKADLIELLEAKRLVVRPYRKSWKGSKKSRPFRRGETLFQKLSEYAEEDNLDVIWWIDRDFLVKDPFRIERDIIKTAQQVSQAIEGHYHHGTSTFFCYQQRTLVVIENEKHFKAFDYLNEECTLLQ